MNRFFIDKIEIRDNIVLFNDSEQLHHLRDVLRIKLLEKVAVFDNSGNEYIVSVSEINSLSARFEIIEKKQHGDLGIKITVACAIPKKVKMDDIIDKLTQLGVECVIPIETERVIVKLDKQKKVERLERWTKVALSATKQSQRSKLPIIKPICDLKDVVLTSNSFDLKLIPTLEGKRKTLKELFNGALKKIDTVMVLIGPEGDFTPEEIALAEGAGFLPVTLGAQVLRVDTAAIAVASFIKLNENH
ncbi:MAG: RsmE family RNA methyltransferase [Candidatus Omnitrophota bacterium]